MRLILLMPIFLALTLVACGGSDKPAASYQMACKGPTSEVLPGMDGNVSATLTDGQGKPVAGKVVRRSVTGTSGPGGLRSDGNNTVTDAAGVAKTTYLVAFDAGWRGEVTVTAETADLQPAARCDSRFMAISPGLPLPPTPAARP